LHIHAARENDGHMLAVDGAMAMVGKSWPAPLTGEIEAPAFVLDTGDAVDWPSFGATEEYVRIVDEVVPWPVYPAIGSHDITEAGRATFERWFLERYGDDSALPDAEASEGADVAARSYVHHHQGVAFVCLGHSFQVDLGQPAQPVWPEDLAWLSSTLDSL